MGYAAGCAPKEKESYHVLYLGKWGPTEEKTREKAHWNAPDTNFVFGFYDEISEEMPAHIDYQQAFALKYPTQFMKKALAVKQVVVLEEIESPLKTHAANSRADRLLAPCRQAENPLFFLGAVFLSFDMLHANDSTNASPADGLLDRHIAQFSEKLRQSALLTADKLSLSSDSIVRLFRCPNCSDICLTINTNQMEDIFLLSKMAQHAAGIIAQNQFSPSWCFAAMCSDAKAFADNFARLRENNKRHITIDFRLSFTDVDTEKNFLQHVPMPDDETAEQTVAPYTDRVGGVLGTGSYSVHLSFDKYLLLHCALWDVFPSMDDVDPLLATLDKSDLLCFLLQCIIGKREQKLHISSQRLRFCYQRELRAHLTNLPSKKQSAPTIDIEEDLHNLQRDLGRYRNLLRNHEYSFQECLAMVQDLLDTYNDILYAENIHSYIFVCQVLALLAGMRRGLDKIKDLLELPKDSNNMPATSQKDYLAKQYTAHLIDQVNQAVVSISEYNRSLMVFSRHTANSPNYEMQSKVNIEKYLIAYAMFLQEISDNFRTSDKSDPPTTPLYPYVHIDIQKTTVEMSTLFWQFHDEGDTVPALLPVACPNYRRFANAYWLLPTLTHEISHQFRYFDRPDRNRFLAKQGIEKVAQQIADDLLLELTAQPVRNMFLHKNLTKSIGQVLWDDLMCHYSEKLANTRMNELEQEIIFPFTKRIFPNAMKWETYSDSLLQPKAAALYAKLLEKAGIQDYTRQALEEKWKKYKEAWDAAQPQTCSMSKWLEDRHPENDWVSPSEELLIALVWFVLNDFTQKNVTQEKTYQTLETARAAWHNHLKNLRLEYGDTLPDAEDARNDFKAAEELLRSMGDVLKAERDKREMMFSETFYHAETFRDAFHYLFHHAVLRILQTHTWLQTNWEGSAYLERLAGGEKLKLNANQTLEKFWMIWFLLMDPQESSKADGDTLTSSRFEALQESGMELIDISYAKNGDRRRQIAQLPDDFSLEEKCAYAKKMLNEVLYEFQECRYLWDGLLYLSSREVFITLNGDTQGGLSEKLANRIGRDAQAWSSSILASKQTDQAFLNKLQDKDVLQNALKALSAKRSLSAWREPWVSYTQIYAEVCSDLGMCAAFRLNAMGYLMLMANQYIQTVDSHGDPLVRFDFRDQRYNQVVDTLLSLKPSAADGTCQSICHQPLYDNLSEALLTVARKINDFLANVPQNLTFPPDLHKKKTKLAEEADSILVSGQLEIREVYDEADELKNLLNKMGESLWRYLTDQEQSYKQKLEAGDDPAETEQAKEAVNNLHRLNDQINQSLHNTRMIQHIANAIINCRMGLPTVSVDESPSPSGDEDASPSGDKDASPSGDESSFSHFRKLYNAIRESPWVQALWKDPFVEEIRTYYNSWCSDFTDYDFGKQNEFVYRYYNRAHARYRSVTEWKKPKGDSNVPASWFALFFENASAGDGKGLRP